MRKIDSFLSKQNIIPKNIIQFPFDAIHNFAWGESAFRIFVDANNSSVLQDGKSWSTAFTSLQQAFNFIPDDMLFYNAFILVAAGNYSMPSIVNKKNGIVFLEYIGDTWNNYYDPDFLTFGKSFSSNPAILQQSSSKDLSGRNFEIHFRSRNPQWQYVYNGWRVQIMPDSTSQYLFTVSGDIYLIITNMVLDASNSGYSNFRSLFRFLNPISSHHGILIDSCSIIGRGNDGTSEWEGSFLAFHDNSQLIRCSIGNGYFPGWATGKASPNSKKFVFNNVKKFFTLAPVQSALLPNMNMDLSSVDFISGSTGQSKIKMSVNQFHYGGKLKIDDNLIDLTDNSGKISELSKTSDASTVYFIGKGYKFNTNIPILSINNSEPSDSILSNKDVAIWIDETNNKLKFKLKYNSGLVKNGEISLT